VWGLVRKSTMKGLILGEEYTILLTINNTNSQEDNINQEGEEEATFSFIACKCLAIFGHRVFLVILYSKTITYLKLMNKFLTLHKHLSLTCSKLSIAVCHLFTKVNEVSKNEATSCRTCALCSIKM
jgi:hypothetical protein